MNSAELLLSKLFSSREKTYPIKLLEDFIQEFTAWKQSINKKVYNEEFLIGSIYKENIFFRTQDEYNLFCRCQVELASRCLNNILAEIKAGHVKHTDLKNHIIEYLFDLSPFVEQLTRKSNKSDPHYVFIRGGKSYTSLSIEMFREANNLFWSSTIDSSNPVAHRTAINLSVFALRQALEIRFRRVIGIVKIIDQNMNDAKLRHDFFLNFIADNLDIVQIRFSSMAFLSKIYKWTNFSIHTGSMANIWEIQYAFEYCNKVFQPDPPDKKRGWNIHSAVKIRDYAELKKRFEKQVHRQLQKTKWQFLYINKPEAKLLKPFAQNHKF